jgi:UDP-N-acetylmuramoyl-tripeptide--D-alanyl-D-alanine ligase
MIGAWTTGRVAEIVGGELHGAADVALRSVVIDSREGAPGALFVGLKGDRADGADFAGDAVSRGAAAVLTTQRDAGVPAVRIRVADTLPALQRLGLENRRRFHGRVAAITGSTGKTTTRRLVAAISGESAKTLEPQKNYNNHIGVPLTLLHLEHDHERAVLELGCSDFGQIALLSSLALPDVALVTNVGPAHLEKLGSLDGVARAKGELFGALCADATAVVNLDDPRVAAMGTGGARRVTYGAAPQADVRFLERRALGAAGQIVRARILGRDVDLELKLAGRHNAANAVAAAAAGIVLGCTIEDVITGLASVAATPGRLYVCRGARGTVVIDDTYNANPSSMAAALEALEELAPRDQRIAVLADMLELGASSASAHREIGGAAARVGLKRLVTFGEGGRCLGEAALAAGLRREAWRHVDGQEEAGVRALESANPGDAILIKGSRGMRMENVVQAVRESEE